MTNQQSYKQRRSKPSMEQTYSKHVRGMKKRIETSINVDTDTSKNLDILVSKGVAPTKKWLVKCLVLDAIEKNQKERNK